MPRFNAYNYDQSAIVAISYQNQLQSASFEHTADYLAEDKFDLSVVLVDFSIVPMRK